MAYWLKEAAKLLWEVTLKDPDFAKKIRLAIKRIEKKPTIGRHIKTTRYVYTDHEMQFRISYNYHSQAKEIEIVIIHIF